MCGEAATGAPAAGDLQGPSPRVRGSPPRPTGSRPGRGSIPACAGKPSRRRLRRRRSRVHPRVCGEARIARSTGGHVTGPSPRVRGSLTVARPAGLRPGSIPACAGKPGAWARWRRPSRVHPRVCGEAAALDAQRVGEPGPSPRVRGSLIQLRHRVQRRGSIPACAGKPGTPKAWGRSPRVHPRVCGEATTKTLAASKVVGPSPRVRGSPEVARHRMLEHGSIPACAGKPASSSAPRRGSRVHPRVCGEAYSSLGGLSSAQGPSPRVRGSRTRSTPVITAMRSIPACAGKPPDRGGRGGGDRVHPRVCGEARTVTSESRAQLGPSPRVRGSRADVAEGGARHGSIPACAGKPTSRTP